MRAEGTDIPAKAGKRGRAQSMDTPSTSTQGQRRYLRGLRTELGIKTNMAQEREWSQHTRAEMSRAIERAKFQVEGSRLSKRNPQEGMASNRAIYWLFQLFSDCRIRLSHSEREQWMVAPKEDVRLKTNELQRKKLQLRDMAGLEPQQWRVDRRWA